MNQFHSTSERRLDTRGSVARPDWRSVVPHAVLALLPIILGLYIPHFVRQPGEGTGFVVKDMPYYLAAGREVFERGNGFAYPNPLDTDPNAPVIYCHWLIWLFGFGIKILHLDPALVFLAAGLTFGLVLSITTRLIVAEVWQQRRFQVLLFYLTMWGGGLICASQAAVNVVKGRDPLLLLFRHDPADGWWFLNWGRNLSFPTETAYHALVAVAWLAALRGRWTLAAVMTALVAATHPWTGLELLVIMSAWWGLRLILKPGRESLKYVGLTALTALCFLAYYLAYLETFPSHAALRDVWSLNWILGGKTIVVAYGSVFILAAMRLYRDRRGLSHREYFLVVCFLAAAALALHDRAVPPVQPIHFTRGYVWTPLFLIALPLLGDGLVWLSRRWSRPSFLLAVTVLTLLIVSDNLAFLTREAMMPSGKFLTLTAAERRTLEWIDRENLTGVVFCEDNDLCYLTATYTGLTPYHGHGFISPDDFPHRLQVTAWLDGTAEGPWIERMDYLLMARDTKPPFLKPGEWRILTSNEEVSLLERVDRR